jgi:uncharacterized protein YndB with AHSA1/START domain
MPTVHRARTIAAPPEQVWRVAGDPYHLSRWWPRVTRVEAVDERTFTQVFTTRKGRQMRADYTVTVSDAPLRRAWRQELDGTPFARFLRSAETEIALEPAVDGARTVVRLEVREAPQGFFNRLGGFMLRRAARRRLDEALDGLERILG